MGLIYVDACLLIHAFEAHPVHSAAVRARPAHLECLGEPMKTGNLVLQRYLRISYKRQNCAPVSV